MDWQITEHEGRTLVRMSGDCDLYQAPRFKSDLLERIDAGADRLLFDMAGVRYLDSTGIGAIISILQAVKLRGGEARFAGLGGSPKRVLELSGLISLMRLEPPSLRAQAATDKAS